MSIYAMTSKCVCGCDWGTHAEQAPHICCACSCEAFDLAPAPPPSPAAPRPGVGEEVRMGSYHYRRDGHGGWECSYGGKRWQECNGSDAEHALTALAAAEARAAQAERERDDIAAIWGERVAMLERERDAAEASAADAEQRHLNALRQFESHVAGAAQVQQAQRERAERLAAALRNIAGMGGPAAHVAKNALAAEAPAATAGEVERDRCRGNSRDGYHCDLDAGHDGPCVLVAGDDARDGGR